MTPEATLKKLVRAAILRAKGVRTPEEHASTVVQNVRDHEHFNVVTDATWMRFITDEIRIAREEADEAFECPECGDLHLADYHRAPDKPPNRQE